MRYVCHRARVILALVLLLLCFSVAPQRVPSVGAQPAAALTPPVGVDLDVTFINRSPMYKMYCVQYPNGIPQLCPGTENEKRWPAPGEIVTFTAHVVNKGTLPSPPAAYRWSLDGTQVAAGTLPTLAPNAEATAVYQWPWGHTMQGERVLDDHALSFTVDPDNLITETYESNNTLAERTNALSLLMVLTPAMAQAYNTPRDPAFSFSAEDWLQRQVAAMNWALANSTYDVTPQGATERVRINDIVISPTMPPQDYAADGRWFVDADYRLYSGGYDPATDIDWSLVHELGHQIGLIDLYNLNIPSTGVQVEDAEGIAANIGFTWPRPDLMGGGDIAPHADSHLYSSHSAGGLSSTKGYRRGYYGEYQYDIPTQNIIRVLDNQGHPAQGVGVTLYQRNGAPDWVGDIAIDNTPEWSGVTDADGRVPLANRSVGTGATTRTGHALHDNPFGVIDVVGKPNRFLVKLARGEHEEFAWLDITMFNLAYWRGNTDNYTFTLNSHIPPTDAPVRPAITRSSVAGDTASICFTPNPSLTILGYNVYRAAPPEYRYERVASLISGPCFTDSFSGSRVYAVTRVDIGSRESAFSSFVWAPRLVNPTALVVDKTGKHVILDPQNGYALLEQRADGRYLRNIGSPHFHLEYSNYLALDGQNRLVFSHPGDYYTDRHSIRVADRAVSPLFEFGERGAGNGQFETPAGAAVTAAGAILVADSGNNRVQAFDPYGGFITAFGGPGRGNGQFNNPQGLAVGSNGSVIVADTGNNRLQVLAFDGVRFTFVRALPTSLNRPTGVTTYQDRIVVGDTGNNSVKALDASGAVLAEYTAPNDGSSGAFNAPRGVSLDGLGTIWVADTGSARVVAIRDALPPLARLYLPCLVR